MFLSNEPGGVRRPAAAPRGDLRISWKTAALLSWDQQVMMPSGGAPIRAEQLATVGRIAHTKFISADIGRLLDDLRDFGEQHEYDSFEASLIRVATRDWEKASKVPPDLRAEMSRSASLANPVWVAARRDNDFASFLPVLRKNLDLRKRYIDCFEVGDEPYDIVLDDYERGMKTAEVRRIFDYLKEHQAPLVKEVAERTQVEKREKTFDIDAQKIFELEVVREFGFTRRLVAPRSDRASVRVRHRRDRHPDHDAVLHRRARGPVRDDARVRARPLRAPGRPVARALAARPRRRRSACTSRRAACGRTSSAGRSRSGAASSRGRRSSSATRSPKHDAESWYREVNAVEPSLIRVEADEATYNLHIILRFELEQAMLADEFPLEQLPEEWNRRMWEYLGIEVPNDTQGRPARRALVERLDRLLPDVRARQLDLRADLGADHRRAARSLRRDRGRRLRAAPRLAAREPPPVRPQVHARRRRSSASSARRRSTPSRTCGTSARSSRASTASPRSTAR